MTANEDPAPSRPTLPDREALRAGFVEKHGPPESLSWGTGMKWRFGYFNPDDHYETTVASLVGEDTEWLDVGCGREIFPSNKKLARRLSGTARRLVGVDPDVTLEENPYVHERVRALMDDYRPDHPFDLVTLRMVAEHVVDPDALITALDHALKPGGRAVIYTVHRYSPIPLLTTLTPMRLRHLLKRWLWRTEEKDTFPTAFRMNTRGRLRRDFARHGFEEVAFRLLDDCRTLARWPIGLRSELTVRRVLRAVGLPYPERCILGVYEKPAKRSNAETGS